MRNVFPITAAVAAGLVGCSDRGTPTSPNNLAIELKPLTLAAVGDICYGP
jgi:hypothetical protein